MPGRSLSDAERALGRRWGDPGNWSEKPQLRSLEVVGDKPERLGDPAPEVVGLRGIEDLIVPFNYPVSALCGNNGVGKSTILALVSLAHHSPRGWFVHRANTRPQTDSGDRSYYTFPDFFVRTSEEVPAKGLTITWRYGDGWGPVSFQKKSHSWGVYSRRPERETHFLPLSRILPAYEMRGVSSAFRRARAGVETYQLEGEFVRYLQFIIGKPYEGAAVSQSSQYLFQTCDDGQARYSAYNMGGGENCIINLLFLLQKMPPGGLLVVEEIEAGLPPHAQRRLAQVLIEVSLHKRIQIICSTHSEIFLDSLPRQARLLITRNEREYQVLESPSTRLAMHEMTKVKYPELKIYCEDPVAKLLIEEAMPQQLRNRVDVKDIGSDILVIRQGVSHLRSGYPMRMLCVLDGDVNEATIRRRIRSENGGADLGLGYILLPGDGLPPERWIVEQLRLDDYQEEFATIFNCSIFEARDHIEAMQVALDPHDVSHILDQRTGLGAEECLRRMISAVAQQHPQLRGLRERIVELVV